MLALSLTCNAQTQYEIELSKNIVEGRMGLWVTGDYKIYVDLDSIKATFRTTIQDYENTILRCSDKDSILVKYYRATSKRYQTALNLLENANNSFDLSTLIIYNGLEDENQNIGNSSVVQSNIKRSIEKGTAIVLYKGERIYKLRWQSELKDEGEILNRQYVIRTYFDDIENCVFTEFRIMGW
jgi:hypothetical protein